MLDFIRIACAVPAVKVGDVKKNAEDICAYIEKADAANADLVVFPELALTGYTCGDLFFQNTLWDAVKNGLKQIAVCSAKYPQMTVVVGLPVRVKAKLYNCAAVLNRGEVCALIPKTHLTAAEKRMFAEKTGEERIWLAPEDIGLVASEDFYAIPLASEQLITLGDDAVVGIEICT